MERRRWTPTACSSNEMRGWRGRRAGVRDDLDGCIGGDVPCGKRGSASLSAKAHAMLGGPVARDVNQDQPDPQRNRRRSARSRQVRKHLQLFEDQEAVAPLLNGSPGRKETASDCRNRLSIGQPQQPLGPEPQTILVRLGAGQLLQPVARLGRQPQPLRLGSWHLDQAVIGTQRPKLPICLRISAGGY